MYCQALYIFLGNTASEIQPSFEKYFDILCMPGTVLGSVDVALKKTN